MPKTIVQRNTRKAERVQQPVPLLHNGAPQNSKRVVQNLRRELPKLPIFSSNNLLDQIRSFTRYTNKNYYLGFGGLG
ncbi:MAG: hypothetical protein GTO02_14775, partial [Candidatus Dadabacteria bacterium]|nr:hypothetical protein [Candidatus Dadabacteria bacterium]